MKFLDFLFYFLLFMIFSCTEAKERQEIKDTKTETKDSLPAADYIIRKFSLPYNSALLEDTNGLLFYSLKGFDTTFLLPQCDISNETPCKIWKYFRI